jgi:glycerol-3-phosphate acyltransferase PlsY
VTLILPLMVLGYLSGSIPFGVLLTRWLKGADVRAQGSGNIGATNVARVAGKKIGLAVLLLDVAKGALPVWFAMRLLPADALTHAGVGLAAFLGHVFPCWLRFKGGKGVATALGVLLVLMPLSAAVGAAVFVGVFAVFRVASIGSLVGSVAAVASSFVLSPRKEYSLLGVVLLVLMVWTHRSNIGRLLRRTEGRL